MTTSSDRVPESVEAEISVLGAVMLNYEEAEEAFELLRPEHFNRPAHQAVWRAMVSLRADGKPIDPLLVQQALVARKDFETAGGWEFITLLTDVVPTAANAGYHAKIVRERALERRILTATARLAQGVQDGAWTGAELAAAAEHLVLDATAEDLPGSPQIVRDLVWPVSEAIDARREAPNELIGIPTGIDSLDRLTGGWRPGQYVVYAARPSEGKTALALYGAMAAARAGVAVLLLSLEMSKDEIVERGLACCANIDGRRMQRGKLDDYDIAKLSKAISEFGTLPLWIDDYPNRTVGMIRALARRWRRQRNIGLVVVDYLQLLHPDRATRDPVEATTEISRGLKQLAREIQVPVVVCCQLNRASEQAPDAKPRLSNLRQSGAIEQDADVVVMHWNNPARKQLLTPPLTLIVAKQRNGPKGEIEVVYDKATGRFGEYREESAAA